jgi:hypothetical protein
MALDPQLLAQFRQICAVASSSATANIFGEIQVGSAATVWCRLESRTRSVERNDGTFEIARMPLLLIAPGVVTPTFESRFWMPGHSSGTAAFARKPRYINAEVDEFGVISHYEIEIES